jgi:hypothetical protein
LAVAGEVKSARGGVFHQEEPVMKFFGIKKLATTVLFASLLIGIYFLASHLGREQIFLKTWANPSGDWHYVVSDDKTEMVQFWYHTKGEFHILHKSGNVTCANVDKLRKLMDKDEKFSDAIE